MVFDSFGFRFRSQKITPPLGRRRKPSRSIPIIRCTRKQWEQYFGFQTHYATDGSEDDFSKAAESYMQLITAISRRLMELPIPKKVMVAIESHELVGSLMSPHRIAWTEISYVELLCPDTLRIVHDEIFRSGEDWLWDICRDDTANLPAFNILIEDARIIAYCETNELYSLFGLSGSSFTI